MNTLSKEGISIFDRIALAFVAGLIAFLSSGFALVILYFAFDFSQAVWDYGVISVWGFTAFIALLGFLLRLELLATVLGKFREYLLKAGSGS